MLGQPQSDEKGSAEQDKSSERGDLRR